MSVNMVEVVIDSIRVGLMSQQRVVILREVDSDRYLAIWVDPCMAEQITFALQEVEVARPMSHDLMKDIFTQLNSRVTRVEVNELVDDVFYGNIVVDFNGNTVNIDSRPSDALALAVRTNVPIMVSRDVMDTAGITPEEDLANGSEFTEGETNNLENGEPGGDERLSVFENFIENISVSDDEENNDDQIDEDPESDEEDN